MRTLKIIFAACIFMVFFTVSTANINIIPRPATIVTGNGNFKLTFNTPIISDRHTRPEAMYLAAVFEKGFGHKPPIIQKGKGIILTLDTTLKEKLGDEGYRLTSQTDKIIIQGATHTGIFYGIQSLRQLLPVNFESVSQQYKKVAVPVVEITDKPRFSWRAFMLDEARHFKGMEEVKKLLDQMALLKMNIFHWHLTDDQGWRIEIKKYPNLTIVGAFRKDTQTSRGSMERTGVPHKGFYTQEQIKEIVRYAQERHIQIVPEIEMPGHAMAAIASYPWLGTIGEATEVPVTFGKMDDSYNVANPKVYTFIEDVLTEVFGLFPGKVIHIGGDEVKYDAWKNSQIMQELMTREGISTPADLQILFTNKISNFIDHTGRRMMGWNEILGGNVHEWQKAEDVQVKQTLAKSAIIHFWKGNTDLIEKAASEGYDIVNSYHACTYLDYNYKTIPLSKAYSFDPIPEGLNEKYNSKILGAGCQMWSEWIPSVKQMHMRIFPRLAAYAEVGWTLKAAKNYDNFLEALGELKKRWQFVGISYEESGEEVK